MKKVKNESGKEWYASISTDGAYSNYYESDFSLFDKLIAWLDWEDNEYEEIEKYLVGNSFYCDFKDELEYEEDDDREYDPVRHYLAYLTLLDDDEFENQVKFSTGKYVDEIDIPKFDDFDEDGEEYECDLEDIE